MTGRGVDPTRVTTTLLGDMMTIMTDTRQTVTVVGIIGTDLSHLHVGWGLAEKYKGNTKNLFNFIRYGNYPHIWLVLLKCMF